MNGIGIAYLTMVILLPSGEKQLAFEQFEAKNIMSEGAISQCNRAGEEFILEDPEHNLEFMCEFVPKEVSL